MKIKIIMNQGIEEKNFIKIIQNVESKIDLDTYARKTYNYFKIKLKNKNYRYCIKGFDKNGT